MSKLTLVQCGGEHKEVSMNVETNDFCLEIGDRRFRFDIDKNGDISILLINGVDMKVISERGYAGIKLYKK